MKWMKVAGGVVFGIGFGFFLHSLMTGKPVESVGVLDEVPRPAPALRSLVLDTEEKDISQPAVSLEVPVRKETTTERSRVIDQLARFNPQHYLRLQSGNEMRLMGEMISELARTDPARAASILNSIHDARLWGILSEKLISSWATTDPKSAYQWYCNHQTRIGDGDRECYLETLLPSLGEKEPQYAWGVVNTIEESWLKEMLMVAIAKGWVAESPVAAFNWLQQLTADKNVSLSTLRSCYSSVMMSYMEYDLDGAARAIQALDSGGLQAQLAEPMVQLLAERDLIGAMVWVQQLESKTAREACMSEIINNYAQDDPAVVLEYVLTCVDPSQESRHLLCSAFMEVSDEDPDLAVSRLDQVPREFRSPIIESITQNWLYQDEKKALTWIEGQLAGESRDVVAGIAAQHFVSDQPAIAFRWAENVRDSEKRLILLQDLVTCADADDLSQIQRLVQQGSFNARERSLLDEQLGARMQNEYPELVLP